MIKLIMKLYTELYSDLQICGDLNILMIENKRMRCYLFYHLSKI